MDTVRILGCRIDNSFIVQQIKTTDRLVSKPMAYETEALQGISVQQLDLIKTTASSLSMSLSASTHLYQTLNYAYDEEYKTMGSKMGQPSLKSINSPMVMDVDEEQISMEAQRLVMEIVRELDGERFYVEPSGQFVAEKIDMLRNALSLLDENQLSRFVAKYAGNDPTSTCQ